jgi:hypothetical protein
VIVTLDLDDRADCEAILLALAILSLDRPGWRDYLAGIAAKFSASPNITGQAKFEAFRDANADRFGDRVLRRAADPQDMLVGWSEQREKSE